MKGGEEREESQEGGGPEGGVNKGKMDVVEGWEVKESKQEEKKN